MKIHHALLFCLLLIASACKTGGSQFGTPEATFATLQEAIKNKDIGLYEQCWDKERVEQEGSISQIKEKPALWDELQGMFKGPQTLGEGSKGSSDDGREKMKFDVEAPEAAEGGIGTLTMIKNGDKWQMYSW